MDQSLLRSLPSKPGVYIFKNGKNKTLYVGKAKDLKKRVASYFSNKALEEKTIRLISEAESVSHIVVGSEIEAFLLEANLIKKFKPFFNIKLSDDKYFPYLKISEGKNIVPNVSITRKIDDKSAKYFGPYTSATDLKVVLRILRRIFPFQSVKNHPPKRCLFNHIGLCPCVTVFSEKLPEYKKNIKNLKLFMEGKKDKVVKSLLIEQKEHIRNEEFEKAAIVQKKLERIDAITSERYDPFSYEKNPDLYFERIRNEVSSLREILNRYGFEVPALTRIECYDVSNISGKNATGSMVVFENGDAAKSEYRRFKIRFKQTPDDFAMHKEMMRRRVRRDDWKKPDLMVIDGGKGQVSAVLQVFTEEKVSYPVVGLAKREETIIVPVRTGVGLDFLEIKLPSVTPGINLLRRIRDEAHRFAITYHRLLRKKSLNI